jgi:hypothetical protein
MGFHSLSLKLALLLLASGAAPAQESSPALPVYRLVENDWGSTDVPTLRLVLDSAILPLWKHFPQRKLEPLVIMRSHEGPITQFRRNLRGEIVLQLDSQDRRWAQFSYQLGHEFCHVLANFDEDYTGNLWFEEMLCETASLYTLGRMAEAWRKKPPEGVPKAKDYAASLDSYRQDVIKSRQRLSLTDLKNFYQTHAEALRQNPHDRAKNGAIAVPMLEFFEKSPQRWQAIAWLNSAKSPPGETFGQYLQKWLHAVPESHQATVQEIRHIFAPAE